MGPTHLFDVNLVVDEEASESEVSHLDDVVLSDQDVGGSQVAVDEIVLLQVHHALRNLTTTTSTVMQASR